MNWLLFVTASSILFANPAWAGNKVEERNAWTETYVVKKTTPGLQIRNIWGDVTIKAGRAGEIVVSIVELRSAPDQKRFDRSMEVLSLQTLADEDGVELNVGDPRGSWNKSHRCKGCRVEYRFEVVVPADTQIDVSTVNDGRVDVSGISGSIIAGNVNGPVSISELSHCAEVDSVNGAIDLSFSKAPADDCAIETVNGDITVSVPEGAGLNVSMDLFNGRMTSDLPVDPLAIPATVEHSERNGRHHYKIDQPAGVRLAGGGPTFTISSLNGNIRIKNTK